MFDSKLKKLGKNVVLGFFAAITLLLTLLCLYYIKLDIIDCWYFYDFQI